MLNLNRKGFTLVELLGIIVILSIVVGIAVPVTTNIVTKSKYKALMTVVDEAEDFIADQWKLKKMDPDSLNDAFKDVMGSYKVGDDEGQSKFITLKADDEKDRGLIEAMGISSSDITSVDVMIASDEIPCVVVRTISNHSRFNSKYWKEDMTPVVNNENKSYYSKCCDFQTVYDHMTKK